MAAKEAAYPSIRLPMRRPAPPSPTGSRRSLKQWGPRGWTSGRRRKRKRRKKRKATAEILEIAEKKDEYNNFYVQFGKGPELTSQFVQVVIKDVPGGFHQQDEGGWLLSFHPSRSGGEQICLKEYVDCAKLKDGVRGSHEGRTVHRWLHRR